MDSCKEFSGSLAPKQGLLFAEFQRSAHTPLLSRGTSTTPRIAGFAPTTRAYHTNRSVPPLCHALFTHLQRLYFYAHSKLRYLTAGSDHRQLKRQQPPLLKFLGWKTLLRAFLNHRHPSPAAQKADPRERLHPSWALGAERAAWAPLHTGQPGPQASPEDTRMLGRAELKKSHQTFRGKKKSQFCLHKIQLNKSGQICTLKNAVMRISTTLRRIKKYI